MGRGSGGCLSAGLPSGLGRAPRYTHSDRIDRANLDAAIVRLYRHDGPLWALLLISLMVGRRSEVFRLTLRDVVVTTREGPPPGCC